MRIEFWSLMIIGSVNYNAGHTFWAFTFYFIAVLALVLGCVHHLLFSEKILCTCGAQQPTDELKIQGKQS